MLLVVVSRVAHAIVLSHMAMRHVLYIPHMCGVCVPAECVYGYKMYNNDDHK